jgi:hypothetical protein
MHSLALCPHLLEKSTQKYPLVLWNPSSLPTQWVFFSSVSITDIFIYLPEIIPYHVTLSGLILDLNRGTDFWGLGGDYFEAILGTEILATSHSTKRRVRTLPWKKPNSIIGCSGSLWIMVLHSYIQKQLSSYHSCNEILATEKIYEATASQ